MRYIKIYKYLCIYWFIFCVKLLKINKLFDIDFVVKFLVLVILKIFLV